MVFTSAQKVTKRLGFFWNKICCKEIPNIAQSGHTDCVVHAQRNRKRRCDKNKIIWLQLVKQFISSLSDVKVCHKPLLPLQSLLTILLQRLPLDEKQKRSHKKFVFMTSRRKTLQRNTFGMKNPFRHRHFRPIFIVYFHSFQAIFTCLTL